MHVKWALCLFQILITIISCCNNSKRNSIYSIELFTILYTQPLKVGLKKRLYTRRMFKSFEVKLVWKNKHCFLKFLNPLVFKRWSNFTIGICLVRHQVLDLVIILENEKYITWNIKTRIDFCMRMCSSGNNSLLLLVLLKIWYKI